MASIRESRTACACLRIVTAVDPSAGVPGLPDWERIPTPGHTPGHVSYFRYFRASDRVLTTGDALLTVNGSSLWGLLPLPGKRAISGPPRISTWNWAAATKSVARLARLEPRVLAPGHGTPMTTAATAAALRSFSDSLASEPRVAPGSSGPPATAAGPGIAGSPICTSAFSRLGRS